MLLLKSRCTLEVGSLLRSSLGSLAVFQHGVLVGLPAHFLLTLLSALHILHSSDFFIYFFKFGQLSPPLMCQILTFFLTFYCSGFLPYHLFCPCILLFHFLQYTLLLLPSASWMCTHVKKGSLSSPPAALPSYLCPVPRFHQKYQESQKMILNG